MSARLKKCLPLIAGIVACGGEGGGGIAREVDGECVFDPGSYVVSYRVIDSTCDGAQPLPNEYMTVSDSGDTLGRGVPPSDCIDSNVETDGCFVAYERDCAVSTIDGDVEVQARFEFDFADGSGVVSVRASLYSGSTLLEMCAVNQGASIRER